MGSCSASSEAGEVAGRRKRVGEAEEVVVVVGRRREGVEGGKTKRGVDVVFVVVVVVVVVGRVREGAGLMALYCGLAVSGEEGEGRSDGEGEDGGGGKGGEEDIAITSSCLVVGNSPPRIGASCPVSVSIERRRRFRPQLLAPNPSSPSSGRNSLLPSTSPNTPLRS